MLEGSVWYIDNELLRTGRKPEHPSVQIPPVASGTGIPVVLHPLFKIVVNVCVCFKDFIFRERGRKGEREGEKH